MLQNQGKNVINILFIVLLLKKAGTKRKTSTSYPSRYSFMKVVCGEIVLATVCCVLQLKRCTMTKIRNITVIQLQCRCTTIFPLVLFNIRVCSYDNSLLHTSLWWSTFHNLWDVSSSCGDCGATSFRGNSFEAGHRWPIFIFICPINSDLWERRCIISKIWR